MVELLFVRAAHDEFGRSSAPDRRILRTRLAMPGSALLADVPAGFVSVPVVRPRENDPALVPDNLLWVQESDALKTVQHFACENGSVPHVRNLNTRYQLE